ncbi:MAG: hypothetical protein J6W54_06360 [Fibrobacter sp.]|nr:hypothetical protein [Fibrobacter sp.]
MDKGMGVEVMPTESLSIEVLEQERLQLLDRLKEIDGLLEKLRMERKTPDRQNADISGLKGVDKYSPVEKKSSCSKVYFKGDRMFSQGGSKVQKQGNRAISLFAKMNGRPASAKSRK